MMRGNAEAEVLLERIVFGGEDRLAQLRRNRLVGDDLAPLDREFPDDLAARAVDARDRARRVVVERRDPAADRPRRRRARRSPMPSTAAKKQNDEAGAAGDPDDVPSP